MSPLKPENLKSLPGPEDIRRVELTNGIVLLTRPNFDSPSVVMNGYLASGSLFDPDDKLSLAHFTAMGLMRGTQRRSFHEIYEAMESVGASLGFGASVHNTSFGGRALAEDLPLLLQLLSESLRQPIFPADQLEKLRAQLMTNLAIRSQDTEELASLAFDGIVFEGHPYSRPEEGYPETVQRVQRDDLVAFHQAHFGPRTMVIVIVGAISPEQAIEQVQSALGDWTNPQQVELPQLPLIKPLKTVVRKHINVPGKSQTDLIMGMLGPYRKSPDYLPASLGNNILGQFGMMGRIGDVVREQAGLAYHASTSLNAWIEAGSWEVSAGVNPANLQRAIDLILSELDRFVREPVSQEELQDSQANFVGRLPLSMESNAGVANALLNLERFQLGLDYYRRYPAMVESVTPEMVLETARRYIDTQRLAIISAGSDSPG
ncbi:MAG TPA: pitrilysin family protein [Anaerolineaceae bacterium]|nr:pitrilysin family protein [Anaerolineaceae bacterium]